LLPLQFSSPLPVPLPLLFPIAFAVSSACKSNGNDVTSRHFGAVSISGITCPAKTGSYASLNLTLKEGKTPKECLYLCALMSFPKA